MGRPTKPQSREELTGQKKKQPPGAELAVTERGTRLDKFSDGDVEAALSVLVMNGGDVVKTCTALASEGLILQPDQLRYWRDTAFAHRYAQVKLDRAGDVGEKIAGKALDRAMQADEAERLYIAKAVERIDEVDANRLAAAARDLAQTKGVNIDKAQLLRNRPTEIRETRDTAEILEQLKRLGVIGNDPRIVDAEVENDEGPR